MSRIIGISGKAGAGKDTLAKYLLLNLGNFKIVHFADLLKLGVQQLCGLDSWATNTQEGKMSTIPWLGITVRELLQKFGTAVREGVHPDFWVKALLNKNIEENIIIADVRFPNEAEAIKNAGGILIRVERKNAGAGDHISETALDNYNKWDIVIKNDYDLDTLKEQAKTIVKCHHNYFFE